MCNCPGNSEDRCGINTNCHNRIMGYECPEVIRSFTVYFMFSRIVKLILESATTDPSPNIKLQRVL